MSIDIARLVAIALLLASCQSGASRGTECRRAADCAAGLVCALGACREACRQSRDCGPAQRCLIEPTTGVSVCSVERVDDCTTHGCPTGLTCASGSCVNACGDVVACLDGVCMHGVCVASHGDGGVANDAGPDASDAGASCHGPHCDPVVQLTLGPGRAIAVTASGAMWGWGDATYGTLGDGRETHASCLACAPTPVQAIGPDGSVLADVLAASTGQNFTCAIRRGGNVWCWGRNYAGQLGNGGADLGDTLPHQVVTTLGAPLDGATLIRSGGLHTCVVRGAAREVWCWGPSEAGQLGAGDTNQGGVAQLATELGTGVVDLAIAGSHSLALGSDGTIRGVGEDVCDELSEPAPSAAALHASVATFTGATSIATSSYHVCAVSGARLACWGMTDAALGSPTGTFMACPACLIACTSMPQMIAQPAIHPITHVHGPSSGTFFGTSDDGALYVWGGGFDEPYVGIAVPRQIPLTGAVREAHVGGGAACALTVAGDVFCLGKNDHGQLGVGTVSTPDVVTATLAPVGWP